MLYHKDHLIFYKRYFYAGFLSSIAASMITPALTICCQYEETPSKSRPLFITPMIRAPVNVPIIPPTPPLRLVPPITTAAIASSSYPVPPTGDPAITREDRIIPARPDKRPARI